MAKNKTLDARRTVAEIANHCFGPDTARQHAAWLSELVRIHPVPAGSELRAWRDAWLQVARATACVDGLPSWAADSPAEDVITASEAAAIAEVSGTYMRRLLNEGDLPGYPDERGRWQVHRPAVIAYAERRRARDASSTAA